MANNKTPSTQQLNTALYTSLIDGNSLIDINCNIMGNEYLIYLQKCAEMWVLPILFSKLFQIWC